VLHVKMADPVLRALIRCACCPDCGRRTFMAGTWEAWYGWTTTCLRCGRTWNDGEWCSLPFSRTARAKSIDAARRAWRRAGKG